MRKNQILPLSKIDTKMISDIVVVSIILKASFGKWEMLKMFEIEIYFQFYVGFYSKESCCISYLINYPNFLYDE